MKPQVMKDSSDCSQSDTAWQLSVIRNPDSLIVRLQPPSDDLIAPNRLAADIQNLLRQHFVACVVLEMDGVRLLDADLIGQLVQLHKQVHADGGTMRLSGLDRRNDRILREVGLEDRFPRYVSRGDTIHGDDDDDRDAIPLKPR